MRRSKKNDLPSLFWRDVVGFEGLYQVSVEGEMRSLDRWVNGKGGSMRFIKGRIMKPAKDKGGYFTVCLSKNGIWKVFYIHRLVAQAWIPNPENLPEVNHKDENKLNNHVENLEWCTNKYNVNWGTAIQRRTEKRSKPVIALDKQGRIVHVFSSTMEAERNGYNQSNVSACCRGEQKTHKGLIWKYKDDFDRKKDTGHYYEQS